MVNLPIPTPGESATCCTDRELYDMLAGIFAGHPEFLNVTDEAFDEWLARCKRELPPEDIERLNGVTLLETMKAALRQQAEHNERWARIAANRQLFGYAAIDGTDDLVPVDPEEACKAQRRVVEDVLRARVIVNTLEETVEAIYTSLAAADQLHWAKTSTPWGCVPSTSKDDVYRVHASTGEGLDRRRL